MKIKQSRPITSRLLLRLLLMFCAIAAVLLLSLRYQKILTAELLGPWYVWKLENPRCSPAGRADAAEKIGDF